MDRIVDALPYDTSCEALYADGYVHSETALQDISPWLEGKNVFSDIVAGLPEAEHGTLQRFSVFYDNNRYDLDWSTVPEGSQPIRLRDGQRTMNVTTGEQTFTWIGLRFGYEYKDGDGNQLKELKEIM